MSNPDDPTSEARHKHNEANKRAKAKLKNRIRDKALFDADQHDPTYFNDIEFTLRQQLPAFELLYAPDLTVIKWRNADGTEQSEESPTRPGALLQVWRRTDLPGDKTPEAF